DAGTPIVSPPMQGAAGRAPVACKPDCGQYTCRPDPVCRISCGDCDTGLVCDHGACRAPAPLRRNGETCATNNDCASNNCGRNSVGEMLCYGILGPNDPCTNAFDCDSGICITMVPGQAAQVCVDGLKACDDLGLLNTCTADLAVAECQFNALCGKLV